MGQIQSLEDLIGLLTRRRWLILAVAVLGIVLAALVARSRPDTYEAAALIQVQGAQIGGTGATGGSAQLLQSIEQRLTTREALLDVITRHDLYADLPALTQDEKIALLRASITFQSIAAAGNQTYGAPSQVSAIIIMARDGDAEKSARIANDFAQGMLDLSSSGQIERARDTYAFYLEERDRVAAEVSAIEDAIAIYKNRNAETLFGSTSAWQDELVGIDTEIRGLDQQLVALMGEQRQLAAREDLRSTERRRLQELDQEIAVLTDQKAALETRREALRADLASLPQIEADLAALERELTAAQATLATVTLRLTEAETEQRLAERQQGERFALLDRAVTPQNPLGSSGRKLFAAGSVVAVFGALALAFLLDHLNPVVRTSAQMERQLGLRPVLAIPAFDLAARPSARPPARPPARPTARGGSGGGAGGPGLAALHQRLLAAPRVLLVSGGMTLVLMTAAAFS